VMMVSSRKSSTQDVYTAFAGLSGAVTQATSGSKTTAVAQNDRAFKRRSTGKSGEVKRRKASQRDTL
jgi:hypothetical protein